MVMGMDDVVRQLHGKINCMVKLIWTIQKEIYGVEYVIKQRDGGSRTL